MDERAYTRAGGLALLLGGVAATVGNLLHPRYPNTDDAGAYAKIAHSAAWRPADAFVMVALVLVTAGLTAVAVSLMASRWGVLASYGRVAAVVGGSIALAATSLDMFAYREAARNFAGAAGPDRNPAFWATNAIDKVGIGLFNTWTFVFLGLAPVLLGLAMLRSTRFPQWIGALGAIGGLACAVVGAEGMFVSDQSSLNIPFLIGSLMVTLWILATGVVLWRSPPAAV